MTDASALMQQFGAGLLFAMIGASAMAGRPTMGECLEGSDFIRNAALSRDAGLSGEAFLERLRGDFSMIHAFPAELRWFAHDEGDERFLAEQARLVFEQPRNADDHRLRFLRACIDRMTDD